MKIGKNFSKENITIEEINTSQVRFGLSVVALRTTTKEKHIFRGNGNTSSVKIQQSSYKYLSP